MFGTKELVDEYLQLLFTFGHRHSKLFTWTLSHRLSLYLSRGGDLWHKLIVNVDVSHSVSRNFTISNTENQQEYHLMVFNSEALSRIGECRVKSDAKQE